uniref:proline-serine-threonine phosphatase-interacting protein 2 isoform X2 n=1 Tax=Gasterosteus aculeatus aculeatus TaxID=481459 RepID=UPI001A982431|nr:proline-serine-threonine phosphatase-interacting protein 2 isoform X2 [Gasterosteus aculeatus aculeatus]
MKDLHFKDFFWNADLTCTGGYDAIIQYLNDGKRTCKEVEEFMKARATVEEKYAKDLLGLSKKVCGHNEMNTLKRSLDMLKLQTEHMEQHMEFFHKQKSSHFKRTMDSKKTYDQKCRDKEEADQNMNRNANTNNTKQIDKLYSKAQSAKQTAEEADRGYHQNVTVMESIRDEWLTEHVTACEMFEKQATERIVFLRNAVWTHLNQLSQQCVTSDELYEEVRKSLEQCDVQEDIGHMINLRRTGDKPPAPVVYDNFYSGQRPPAVASPPRLPPPISRRGPLPEPTNSREDTIYSTVQDSVYSVIHY